MRHESCTNKSRNAKPGMNVTAQKLVQIQPHVNSPQNSMYAIKTHYVHMWNQLRSSIPTLRTAGNVPVLFRIVKRRANKDKRKAVKISLESYKVFGNYRRRIVKEGRLVRDYHLGLRSPPSCMAPRPISLRFTEPGSRIELALKIGLP